MGSHKKLARLRNRTKSGNCQTESRNLTLNPRFGAARADCLPRAEAAVPSSEICCFHRRRGGVFVVDDDVAAAVRARAGACLGTESKP